jgi:hypothetical protein
MTGRDLDQLLRCCALMGPEAEHRLFANAPEFAALVRRLGVLAPQVLYLDGAEGRPPDLGHAGARIAYLEYLLNLDALVRAPTATVLALARGSTPN